MAIVIKSIDKDLGYVPMSEIGTENPFTVFLKPLSAKELLLLEDKVVKRDGEEMSFAMGQYAFNVCKAATNGWSNINDAEGKAISFEKSADGIALDSTVALMGVDIIQEVANVITAISRDQSKIATFFPEVK
jgi:hypothetical protein